MMRFNRDFIKAFFFCRDARVEVKQGAEGKFNAFNSWQNMKMRNKFERVQLCGIYFDK